MSRTHPYYPVYLDLENRTAVVVGGGGVSARKVQTLLRCGARVTVIAPEVAAELESLASARLTIHRRPYHPSDLDGADIVIASTDDAVVNAAVAEDCHRMRIPVNVVDAPDSCDFIVPAVIDLGSVQLAVSTGGRSPALARRLKYDLLRAIGPEYAEVNDIFGSLRERAKTAALMPADADRKFFFDELLAAGLLEMLRGGRRREAYETIARACERAGVPLPERVSAELEKLRDV